MWYLTEIFIEREHATCPLHMGKKTYLHFAFTPSLTVEEKALYSAELEKHKKEKAELRRKVEMLEDRAAALQVFT